MPLCLLRLPPSTPQGMGYENPFYFFLPASCAMGSGPKGLRRAAMGLRLKLSWPSTKVGVYTLSKPMSFMRPAHLLWSQSQGTHCQFVVQVPTDSGAWPR